MRKHYTIKEHDLDSKKHDDVVLNEDSPEKIIMSHSENFAVHDSFFPSANYDDVNANESGKVPSVVFASPFNNSPSFFLNNPNKKKPNRSTNSSWNDTGILRYWQSPLKDQYHRLKIIQKIVSIVKPIFLDPSPERRTKLPKMVRQLEAKLYRTAKSLEDYMDFTTLERRLALMIKASLEKRKIPPVIIQIPTKKDPIRPRVLRLLLLHHSSVCTSERCAVGKFCQGTKQLWEHMVICQDPRRCPVPHCRSSHSVLNHFKRCKDQACPACIPVRKKLLSDSVALTTRTPRMFDDRSNDVEYQGVETLSAALPTQCDLSQLNVSMRDFPIRCHPVEHSPSNQGEYTNFSSNAGELQQNPPPVVTRLVTEEGTTQFGQLKCVLPDNDWKTNDTDMMDNVVEYQQHKNQLVLLYHAYECRHNEDIDGPCPHNEHCSSLKRLWEHMKVCKDQQRCELPQCRSSWDLLHRYQSRSSRRKSQKRSCRKILHHTEKQSIATRKDKITKDDLKRSFPMEDTHTHTHTAQAKRAKNNPNDSSDDDMMLEVHDLLQS